MPHFVRTDWYKYPKYYDIVFDGDTPQEADFLEMVCAAYCRSTEDQTLRVLEPACGTGRLMFELARRGHEVAGFDASPEMIAYVRKRTRSEAPDVRKRIRVRPGRMQAFRYPGPFDLAHCLLSTFKYLLTEKEARSCLKCVARSLAPGGIFVLGIHLADYARRTSDGETWEGSEDGVRVHCETITRPADRENRLEWLRNRLRVKRVGSRSVEVLETNWQCRTYDAAELKALLASVPELEIVACYDFNHNMALARALDDSQEDLVVVLRKRMRNPVEKSPGRARSRARS